MKNIILSLVMVAALFAAPSVYGLDAPRQIKGKQPANTQSSFKVPDFAYPQTVARDAEVVLRSATASSIEKIQAAIQLTAARNSISVDNISATVACIDSLARVLPAPYSQIMYSLESQLFEQYYRFNGSQRADSRTTTDDDSPALWNKDAFTLKIMDLVRHSLSGPQLDTPLSVVAPLLDDYKPEQSEYYPTVYDLLAYRALEFLAPFKNNQTVIPFNTQAAQAQPPAQQAYIQYETIVDGLIDRYAGQPKPLSRALKTKYNGAEQSVAYAAYSQWQKRTADNPGTMVFVYMMGLNCPSNLRKEYYTMATGMLQRYPTSEFAPAIRSSLALMSIKSVTIQSNGLSLTGQPLKVTVNAQNANKYYVLLFKVENKTGENTDCQLSAINHKPVEIQEVTSLGTVPFSSTDSIVFGIKAPLSPGYYVAVPSDTQSISGVIGGRNRRVRMIRVGSTSGFSVSGSTDANGNLYVVDAKNGKPVANAVVEYYSRQWNKRNSLLLKNRTNHNGLSALPNEWSEARIRFDKNRYTEVFSMDAIGKQHAPSSSQNKAIRATILTDLPIYRPNDTVQFAVIAYTDSANSLKATSGLPVNVELYDVNNTLVGDTLHLQTDIDGRLSGKLPILSTGPTGTYRISVSAGATAIATSFITVAEYVAPTFFVETDTIATEPTAGSAITVKGKVMTYSGMPLAGADVNMTVNYRQLYWWRMYAEPASYGASTVTNDKGEYQFLLNTTDLAGTRFAEGVFDISVTATSPAGESQAAAPTAFMLGKGFRLAPYIPSRICVTEDEVKFHTEVQNTLGTSQSMKIDYVLTNSETGRTIATGSFTAPDLAIASELIPSGPYRLQLTLAADTSVTATCNTVVYRTDDKRIPDPSATIWIPQTKITATPNAKKVQIQIGSGYPDSYVLMETGSSDGRILDTRWLCCGPKLQTVEVPAPQNDERIWVRFHGMHNFAAATETVEILPSASTKKLDIEVKSFRNKIIPGSKEVWEFTVKEIGDGAATASNVPAMAVMSNQALNAIVDFRWDFSPRRTLWWRNPLNGTEYSWFNPVSTFSASYKPQSAPYITCPTIYLYNRLLSGALEYVNVRYYTTSAGSAPLYIRGSHKQESTSEQEAATDEEIMYDAPAMGAIQENKAANMTDGVSIESDGGATEQPSLRDNECPLAFFSPNLCTDTQGNLKVSFTAPDFNTTWQLQLMAYDRQLYTTTKLLTAMASKPVMVQTTAPRFLRTADRPVLTAMAFNNTDSTATIGGYIEIFDPATEKVLQHKEYPAEMLAAKESRVFTIDVSAPDTLQFIGMRAVATSGKYSDGEQIIINIAPSSTPVIDAVPFYMAPKDSLYTVKLPEFKDNGTVTLQFTDNPVWYCVTALPDIAVPESDCLNSLLYAYFGNELAASLVKQNPGISQALQVWSQTQSSALVSPLLKDESLKTTALQQTIWVQNAQSETMRMMRLQELLDPAKNSVASKTLIEKIAALQTENGGWSWLPEMRPSLYMTTEVLSTFGHLKALGVTIDENAEAFLNKGIRFADKEIYKVYEESVKLKSGFPTSLMLDYFTIRGEYSEPLSGRMQSLKSLTLTHTAREWRSMNLGRQASAALFLHTNGRHKDAANILESLRQRASFSPQKGMWFDNLRGAWSGDGPLRTTARVLEAFATITPHAPEVDWFRQWLTLQRQTQNWGDNRMTAEVIYVILTTGSTWTTPAMPPCISIDGKRLEPGAIEALTGSFSMALDARSVSGKKLTIKTYGAHPAWGGVIQQYFNNITDVQAASVPDLTIDKQIYVVETTPEGEKLRIVDDATLKVGQRVRISLTLTAGRDLDYVAVTDSRSACLQPVKQLATYMRQGNIWFYYEPRNEVSNIFIDTLTKGAHVLTYDCYVQQAGLFSSGIATAQCQYAPMIITHSAGLELKIIE